GSRLVRGSDPRLLGTSIFARERKEPTKCRRTGLHHPYESAEPAAASPRRQATGSGTARRSHSLLIEPHGTQGDNGRPAASTTMAAAITFRVQERAREALSLRSPSEGTSLYQLIILGM